ncbi:hypothetical protein TREES_T100014645 [Tupaia chinensis]|uniref:Uncharacterized protein n=1 Tax=Tupaia chinensis TaxID=246437 RepID=L9KX56_TUPCH|nr:hypothetical protein TREES_T100014645 [Tupaia chinensis]
MASSAAQANTPAAVAGRAGRFRQAPLSSRGSWQVLPELFRPEMPDQQAASDPGDLCTAQGLQGNRTRGSDSQGGFPRLFPRPCENQERACEWAHGYCSADRNAANEMGPVEARRALGSLTPSTLVNVATDVREHVCMYTRVFRSEVAGELTAHIVRSWHPLSGALRRFRSPSAT